MCRYSDMTMFDRVDSFLASVDAACDMFGICLADGTVLCDEFGEDTGYRVFVDGVDGLHNAFMPDGLAMREAD